METTVSIPTQLLWTKVLMICGMLSSLLYISMNIFLPMQYDGYSILSQTVSELSAIGAPTRPKWVLLGVLYSILVTAFGLGVRRSAGHNNSLRIAGNLIIAYAVIGAFWPPMHQREAISAGEGSISDNLHIAFTIITVPLMLLSIWYASKAFNPGFRRYSYVTIVLEVLFGLLTGTYASRMEAALPTPLMGLWERIGIGAHMMWVVVLAVMMLKREFSRGITARA